MTFHNITLYSNLFKSAIRTYFDHILAKIFIAHVILVYFWNSYHKLEAHLWANQKWWQAVTQAGTSTLSTQRNKSFKVYMNMKQLITQIQPGETLKWDGPLNHLTVNNTDFSYDIKSLFKPYPCKSFHQMHSL